MGTRFCPRIPLFGCVPLHLQVGRGQIRSLAHGVHVRIHNVLIAYTQ